MRNKPDLKALRNQITANLMGENAIIDRILDLAFKTKDIMMSKKECYSYEMCEATMLALFAELGVLEEFRTREMRRYMREHVPE